MRPEFVTPTSPLNTESYTSGRQSFVPDLLPDAAVRWPVYQTLDVLTKRFGYEAVYRALDATQTVESPAQSQPDSRWLRRANMVGINVRTIGTYWNVVNYVLTLPAAHDSIHLLPVWEPGVVGSLYGMVSWNINPEAFSRDLYQVFPALNTSEKQLKVVVNLLHLMGRTVGMDVIPHTDRFSEMTLCHPHLFEWVRRDGPQLVDHSEGVAGEVQALISQWSVISGQWGGDQSLAPATPQSFHPAALFGDALDYGGRLQRRLSLIRYLVERGYETLPMTMAPPYRGLYSKPDQWVTDEYGQRWYEYGFLEPQPMSRVFGPLTRYKFFHAKDDNRAWQLDFERPNVPAWQYLAGQYAACQEQFGFDFMRGDMAHVQMRSGGVPAQPDVFYDPLQWIKRYIQTGMPECRTTDHGLPERSGVPHFAFFAETFLAPPDTMGYGDEVAHLEAIEADATLGDLQSTVVGTAPFRTRFRQYLDLAQTRNVAPNFTVMTADKDDPRFDEFYRTGNVFRYFVALFMPELPSYVGLGFEVRNRHLSRGQNEEYSKLYVFQVTNAAETDKVTTGPFVWGRNHEQFRTINRLRLLADELAPALQTAAVRWLIPPDPTGDQVVMAWMLTPGDAAQVPNYVFVANMNPEDVARHLTLPPVAERLTCVLDTADPGDCHQAATNGRHVPLPPLGAGACRVYRTG